MSSDSVERDELDKILGEFSIASIPAYGSEKNNSVSEYLDATLAELDKYISPPAVTRGPDVRVNPRIIKALEEVKQMIDPTETPELYSLVVEALTVALDDQ
jgi:hypothetical protein